jgi:esterase/lipase
MRCLPFLAGLGAILAHLGMPAPAMAAAKPETIGVVLLHGKSGRPDDVIAELANRLDWVGFKVERPEMCWSNRRIYDRPFVDCLAEIDTAVARLKGDGARHIVIAGMSLGGAAALSYGASRDGLAGIIALAPAHNPMGFARNPRMVSAVEEARRLAGEGKANEVQTFADTNLRDTTVRTTPAIYLSFFDPERPELQLAHNIAGLRAPLLWVAGDRDQTQRRASERFQEAPANQLNRFVSVSSDHFRTPTASQSEVVQWLRDLAATLS